LALLALSLSHPAIKNLLTSSLLSTWSPWAYISNNLDDWGRVNSREVFWISKVWGFLSSEKRPDVNPLLYVPESQK
jgi:hypothetical protein